MSTDTQDSKQGKKPIFKKWWFWVVVIAIFGSVYTSLGSDEPVKVGGSNDPSQGQQSDDPSQGQQSDDPSQGQSEFKVGDVIAFDGKEITVQRVERNWTAKYVEPSAGKEYVKVSVYIENKSDTRVSFNTFDWEMQDGNGAIESTAWVSDDDNLGSGELAKGGKKSGSVIFEVPKDDANLILHYSPAFWSNRDVEIVL
ncbi:MAG: DUF4352 domain-containing protein [Propionibacteriaceae bacterium]|jgi:hypothetical protein|nr:DUF4352 domain-containing protein [Propionibacteriaceae bacterium]